MSAPIWTPPPERVAEARMTAFTRKAEERAGHHFPTYHDLWRWSVEERAAFWQAVWDFGEIRAAARGDEVVRHPNDMLEAEWFPGARLNFAENLLRYGDDRTALVFRGEGRADERITYRELSRRVARAAAALRSEGIGVGDRVAGFMPNVPESVVAMLATTSLGAVWSSCSPDFGVQGVVDRFAQIEPKVLVACDGYVYRGREHDRTERLARVLGELPTVERTVVVPHLSESPDLSPVPDAVAWPEFMAGEPGELEFEQLPFDHPVYILYSSGTTGPPKSIVHGAGGTLLQHVKELWLHTDVDRDSRVFYFTTCGWMMWNWLVSALTAGATVMLYDGDPLHPDPGVLWRWAEEEGMTVFGTSARYLGELESRGYGPGRDHDLSSLATICSTGSPLPASGFEYVYREVKEDVCLSSISGGTDIVSCFALGNPTLPVRPGELQCRGLGMKVDVFDGAGNPLRGEMGELVCTAPFPSQPVGFWNDPSGERYRAAYFETYPGVWHHGDYATITEHGGMVITGRSDATLNPGGVRIGTAEIYSVVEEFEEVADSLAVGHRRDGDERMVLFVRLVRGEELTAELEERIREALRRERSPRHVPAEIFAVEDIPYTISGKKVELAVRKIIHGEEVENRDAMENPEALELYRRLPVGSAG